MVFYQFRVPGYSFLDQPPTNVIVSIVDLCPCPALSRVSERLPSFLLSQIMVMIVRGYRSHCKVLSIPHEFVIGYARQRATNVLSRTVWPGLPIQARAFDTWSNSCSIVLANLSSQRGTTTPITTCRLNVSWRI